MRRAALLLGLFAAGCGGEDPPPAEIEAERAPPARERDPARAQDEPAPLLPPSDAAKDPLATARVLRDPGGDDWEVEQRDRAVHVWWERLAGGDALEELLAPDLQLAPLRPETAEQVSGVFSVARATNPTQPEAATQQDFARALDDLLGPGGFDGLERHSVKVVSIDGERARLRLELVWPASSLGGVSQLVSHWDTSWSEETSPRLSSLAVVDFLHTESSTGWPLFTDVTAAVLGANASFDRQLGVGLARWSATLDAALGTSVIGHEGLALGDADGDGLDDLYICQPGGLPNLLFLRRADGTAEDVSRAAGVDWLDASRSALFADLDGDGDQDLVVEADPELLLMRNEGEARFILAAAVRAPATTSLSAADADGDGDLDLYACAYMLPDSSERVPLPYHDANNGRRNTYLSNEIEGDDWSFVDATAASGLDRNNRRFSFAASWEDYDGDGDLDLYVANDFGRNNLYRNETVQGSAARFVDVAAEAGVEDMAAGMGVTWADVNGDGRDDLYVSNMFSSAGGRITYQRRFKGDAAEQERAALRRHARGNSLFLNQPDGTFRDVSLEAGASMGRWSWGALFTDFENDGDPDLVVPNGFVTGEDPLDL